MGLGNIQTAEMFGKQISYDSSKPYGMYDEQGHYRRIDVKGTLPTFAGANKMHLLEFLDSQVETLKSGLSTRKERDKQLDDMINPINAALEELVGGRQIVNAIGPEESQSIQNTMDLFKYIATTLRG